MSGKGLSVNHKPCFNGVCFILQVGSDSAQGAGSPALFEAINRISRILGGSSLHEGLVERTIRRSFLGKKS
jgi:aspartyl aminopeptidase